MYRVHRILPAIAFALCVMLGTAASAVPEFFVCESDCSCQRTLNAPEEYEDKAAEVTRVLCLKVDSDLCGWQLDLKGFDASRGGAGTTDAMRIAGVSVPDGNPRELVFHPVPPEETSEYTTPQARLSLNWVNLGNYLEASSTAYELGEITLSSGEKGSRLSALAKSLAVAGTTDCDDSSAFKQIAVDSGPVFMIPEPPRLLLLA
ncbi:MAG: hypothetical protein AAEJ53_16470, partial [Myxococcota bacterium]